MRKLTIAVALSALCLVGLAPQAWAGDMASVDETRAALAARGQAIKENALRDLPEAERLQLFIDLYFEWVMNEHPEFATMIGHPTGHDRWTDNSLEAEAWRDEQTIVGSRDLEIDRPRTAPRRGSPQLRPIDGRHGRQSVEAQKFKGEYLAINQMGGVHQNSARMMAMMPTANKQNYMNIHLAPGRHSRPWSRTRWFASRRGWRRA